MALEIGIDLCGTLNATDYKEPQVVCLSIGNGQADGLINPPELAQTLNCMHDQQAVLCYENHANDSRITESNDVSPLISSRAGTGGGNLPLVQERFVKTARPTFDQGDKGANELVCEAIAFEPGVAKREGGDSRFSEELCGTLRSNMGDNQTAVAAHSTVRRLLPIECERLMGFPDNWTRIPWKGLKEEDCPDSPRYKACGNSFCVNVVQWIGEQIDKVEKRK